MNSRFLRLIQTSLFCLDLLSINLSVIVCLLWLNTVPANLNPEYGYFWIWLNAAWLIVTWVGHVYHEKYILSFEIFSRRTMHAYFYWLVLLMFYLYFTHQFVLSRVFIATVLITQGLLLVVDRFIYLVLRAYFRRSNSFGRKVMIVGYNNTAKKLATYLEQEGMNTEIVGFCEETENVRELTNYPIIDSVSNAMTASKVLKVDEIYSTIAPEHNLNIYNIMKEADRACIHFWLIPDLSLFIKKQVYINYLKDIPVLAIRQEPLNDAGNRIRKRVFDIIFSSLVIIFILSWLLPIISLLILIDSGWPVFFKQARSGRGTREFICLKFRSMKVNKEANLRQATANDDRLTSIGRFLRKTNLDEFPQFFNVLMGDMSIVGPRPHMIKHTHDYSKLIDDYMVRQFLKPGITGWAQVNGFRGETKTIDQMKGRVEHDIWYMENWELWLDLRIVFTTVYNMLMGDKNAF